MIDFAVAGRIANAGYNIPVFTTRPDTLYGATYMVLAPEHPLVDRLTTDEQRAAVQAYRDQVAAQSPISSGPTLRKKRPAFLPAHLRSTRQARSASPSGSPITC